jgi:hypothetical protein
MTVYWAAETWGRLFTYGDEVFWRMSEWRLLDEKRERMWSEREEFFRVTRVYEGRRGVKVASQRKEEESITLAKARKGECVEIWWNELLEILTDSSPSSAELWEGREATFWDEYIDRCLSSIWRGRLMTREMRERVSLPMLAGRQRAYTVV